MSYKVEVKAVGEKTWRDNALRFATEAEAMESGRELADRWWGAGDWRAITCDDAVNYEFDFVHRLNIPLET